MRVAKACGSASLPTLGPGDERDLAIYALGVGAAHNPLDDKELQTVYELHGEGRSFTATAFGQYLGKLVAKYPIITIEDGMAEGDWDGWAGLTKLLGKRTQLVGKRTRRTHLVVPLAMQEQLRPRIGRLPHPRDRLRCPLDRRATVPVGHHEQPRLHAALHAHRAGQ